MKLLFQLFAAIYYCGYSLGYLAAAPADEEGAAVQVRPD